MKGSLALSNNYIKSRAHSLKDSQFSQGLLTKAELQDIFFEGNFTLKEGLAELLAETNNGEDLQKLNMFKKKHLPPKQDLKVSKNSSQKKEISHPYMHNKVFKPRVQTPYDH